MAPVGTQGLPLAVPTELTLHVGERVTIPLTSAGSVGYGWTLSVSDGDRTISAAVGPEQPGSPDAPPGGSVQQVLSIVARAPGRSMVQLRLMRFSGQPPRESHDIDVTVAP